MSKKWTGLASAAPLLWLLFNVAGCSDDGATAPDAAANSADASSDSAIESGAELPPVADAAPEAEPDQQRPDTMADTIAPPANATCATAAVVAVAADGPTTINGNTRASSDEHPLLSCGAKLVDGTARAFDGPQVYFRLTLTRGSWSLRLSAQFGAVFYAFPFGASVCQTAAAIDTACQQRYGFDKLAIEVTQPSEDWIVAVDSENSTREGPFALVIEPQSSPAGQTCANPVQLVLGPDGSATFSGTTRGAADTVDVSCGGLRALSGGQVFHRVQLEAGKSYRVRLTADDDLALYAFAENAGCSKTAIEAACTPAGPNPLDVPFSDRPGLDPETVVVSPVVSGPYVISVDSPSPRHFADYRLSISELTVAGNGTCATARAVDVTTLPTTVEGDTTGISNDLTGVTCGLGAGAFDGGQLYYELSLLSGKTYLVSATGLGFDAGIYAFPQATACTPATVSAACQNPTTPDPSRLLAQDSQFGTDALSPETIRITPTRDELWIVAVDTLIASDRGAFTLEIREHQTATNQVCGSPQVVTLADTAVVIRGDTSLPGTQNELGHSVTCAAGLPWGLDGPQLYYRMTLVAPNSYTVRLRPSHWDAALYAFPASASCTASGINAGCWGGGTGGPHYSDRQGEGLDEEITITPSGRQDWVIAVDSHLTTGLTTAGSFALEISWK